jgi:hypothetical protein
MRGINFVALVFASVLVVIPGLGNAGILDQIPRKSVDAEQRTCADQSRFVVAAAEMKQVPAEKEEAPSEDVQERGVPKINEGLRVPGPTRKVLPLPPAQPGGGPPPNLCHQVTIMRTQCRCSNDADCQVLSPFCPGTCPAGSHSCQCIPMFRGTAPQLPPDLCGFQVPEVFMQCSCSNDADCQVLSPFCPGACPPGSHTCQCTPLRRR